MAFANYSHGLYAAEGKQEPEAIYIDYSKVRFSTNPETLIDIAK